MSKIRLLALSVTVAAAGLSGLADKAEASAVCSGSGGNNTCTISNSDTSPSTVVEAYSLGTNTASSSFFNSSSYFGSGSEWGANVGGEPQTAGDYTTTGLSAAFTQGTGGNGTVTLTFNTSFASTCTSSCGVDALNSTNKVYAADIFIDSNPSSAAPTTGQSFNYAIALGYTNNTTDQGKALGLYAGSYGGSNPNSNSQDYTSNNIWGSSGRNSGVSGWYGGAFAATTACSGSGSSTSCSNAVTSPTVVTGGSSVSGITVDTPTWSSSAGTMSVSLTGSDTALAAIFSDFDIFWGTGDCSNAPIWGNVSSLMSVPEPSSLALLLTAAVGLVAIRRRKKVPSTNA